MKIFCEEWNKEFAEKINSNKEYFNSAQGWVWPMILTLEEESDSKSIFIDLENGICKSVKSADEKDFDAAEFIISASKDSWSVILSKKLDPMMAVMVKKLEMKKGNVGTLLKYVDAAKALINSATKVTTEL